jgi:hypothetical protein
MKAIITACAIGAAMTGAAYADNLSASSDVLGVKLGMTELQAAEALKPSTIQTQKLKVGALEFGSAFSLKASQRNELEQYAYNKLFPGRAAAPDNGATVDAMFGPRDNLRMVIKLNANRSQITGIYRQVRYVGHDNPLREVVVKAVYAKYGRPRTETSQFGMSTMQWVTGSARPDFCVNLMQGLLRLDINYQLFMRRGGDGLESFERRGAAQCGVVMRVWMNVNTQNGEVIEIQQELMDVPQAVEGLHSYKALSEEIAARVQDNRRREHLAIQPKL